MPWNPKDFPSLDIKLNHRHSFNVSVPLKMGRTAPMFVLSFFLHSILFAGSALDSFQCLRSLLIVSFHVFFGLPRPRCPSTSNSVMLLIQPSFLTTCPNQMALQMALQMHYKWHYKCITNALQMHYKWHYKIHCAQLNTIP